MVIILVIFVITSIPFIYIPNIKISAAIKNKKPIKEIIFFNTVIKILLCLGLIFLINSQIANYTDIKKIFDGSYKTWESASSYRVMSLNSGNITMNDNNIPIYKYFNARGSIFAGFAMYEKGSLNGNKDLPMAKFNALVNPNYLKENPIYDLEEKQVSISERNKNWVFLVPDKYKKDESEIRAFYQVWIDSCGNSYIPKPSIEIIWIIDNQKAFSYDVTVYPENGYYVTDPILFVGTEDGGYPQWDTQIFNVAGSPFKVKIPPNENDKA